MSMKGLSGLLLHNFTHSINTVLYSIILYDLVVTLCKTGRYNLRSFLAENSAQNYFLIARMFSSCDIRDKNAVFDILRQNVTNFDLGNG